jgi:NADH-quinone oxidoreductase subunit L
VLLVLSTFVGAMIVPPLQGVLPDTTELEHGRVLTLEITSGVVAIAGILIAAWLWLGKRTLVTPLPTVRRAVCWAPGGTTRGASTGCTTCVR